MTIEYRYIKLLPLDYEKMAKNSIDRIRKVDEMQKDLKEMIKEDLKLFREEIDNLERK